ncbi:DNA alkylation repair protein [Rheinheimera riviphila]|uniref:DNA alkylation repair protein n=1 Tax=Rheinheimera riviphila TaxID=1834037 RepID=A0A437QZP0_9GAMM|nr:DNA alkylation repair protein [Rheinheimera riviphila]RVU39923.1 DNA alkylation repair protein [Rheinheimera riviphila]
MSAPLLKDLIDVAFMQRLGNACHQLQPTFDSTRFVSTVVDDNYHALELKARIQRVATILFQQLALPFVKSCEILKPLSSQFGGIQGFVFPEVVAQFGLDQPDIALPALGHFTQFSTSEFAIRPFISRYPELTLPQLALWAQSDNHHLRRLASEGSRPRLPWGQALPQFKKDPTPLLPILEQLKQDPSDYVRRSVANHLNDISKDRPELMLELCQRWFGQHPDTDWIVKHALRGLLRQRHPVALQLFGYQPLAVQAQLQLPARVKMGERLEFSVLLSQATTGSGKTRVEYAIDFASKAGKPRHKVFQWLERVVNEPELTLQRSYLFKDLTTRKHYAGEHRLYIIVNGQIVTSQSFLLENVG